MTAIQQRRKLNTKCLQQRYKALSLVETGLSKTEVIQKFQVRKTALPTWIKNKQEI